jgi:cyd operon protein YbgT
MWYFTWILGLGLALTFGIINVMWLETSYFSGELDEERVRKRFQRGGRPID